MRGICDSTCFLQPDWPCDQDGDLSSVLENDVGTDESCTSSPEPEFEQLDILQSSFLHASGEVYHLNGLARDTAPGQVHGRACRHACLPRMARMGYMCQNLSKSYRQTYPTSRTPFLVQYGNTETEDALFDPVKSH
ncbi:hypothetical protein M8818_001726 [Zalaria obscura]|uniref:Uncharacterized protein n=1 Tax=Zalaria obscura TaxID=2024903 RepID=A0ACC3SJQ6_9PEZI